MKTRRHLCPRCKEPMTIELRSLIGSMGDKARVVCSANCGVCGEWRHACSRDAKRSSVQLAWIQWKEERNLAHGKVG